MQIYYDSEEKYFMNHDTFNIQNGTRQGSAASPAIWSVYLDPLFALLREAGYKCYVGGVYTTHGTHE